MIKILKIFFVLFLFITPVFASAENITNEKSKSHFWLYFVILFLLLSITFYYYTNVKYVERIKKYFIYFFIFIFSFTISSFLDYDFKDKQEKSIVKNKESSDKIKFTIEKMKRIKLQKRLDELEYENFKLKLLKEKIKQSKQITPNIKTSKEDILKNKQIENNIKKLQKDLLNIEKSIIKVREGDYTENLGQEFTVSQKLQNRKRRKQQELENRINNYKNKKNNIFSVDLEKEDDFYGLEEEEIVSKKELENYKRELAKANRKIIIVKGNQASPKTLISKEKKSNIKERNYTLEEKFLRNHYEYILKKNFKKAYEESSKKTDYKTYQNWYKNVVKITVNKIYKKQKANNFYFVDLNIFDNSGANNYLVLKELSKLKGNKFKIKTSKTIKITKIDIKKIKLENQLVKKDEIIKNNFGIVTNQELKKILKTKNKKYLILDSREDIERKTGYIKGSIFFRFADLIAGNYKKLDKTKIIIIYTWEKTKSIEVSKFLASKGLNVKFLENGISGWLKDSGEWQGEKDVFKVYKNPRFKHKFSKIELEKEYKKGIYLVDVRKKEFFDKSHLKGSFNIPLVYLSKIKWNKYIKQIPKDSEIATICSNSLNCFYARVVGIEMQKRGYKFMGYYNLLGK